MSIIVKKDGKGRHIINLNGTQFDIIGLEDGTSINDIFNFEVVSEINNGYFDFNKMNKE